MFFFPTFFLKWCYIDAITLEAPEATEQGREQAAQKGCQGALPLAGVDGLSDVRCSPHSAHNMHKETVRYFRWPFTR